ncbi:MAG: DNA/RNA non-specific endonuclease [Bacteroidales bacterium]|nr:DNA/RNA non-specific endonuclease [Bacteroidales bacterium]
MKISRFFIAFASAILAAACTAGNLDLSSSKALVTREFTASLDASPDTRTSLGEQGKVLWDASGESITIVDEDGLCYKLTQNDVSSDGLTATFTGEVPETGCKYAIYPAQSEIRLEDGAITLSLPDRQNAVEDGFESGANLAISKVEGDKLSFKNICGILSFSVTADDITSISFSADEKSGGALTGSALTEFTGDAPFSVSDLSSGYGMVELKGNIKSGSRYLALAYPGIYNNLKVIFTNKDGRTATFTKDATLTIERSKILKISPFTISDKDWDDYTEPGGTAMLTYDEASDYVKGYGSVQKYTNQYGTWTICASKQKSFQLNNGKVAYLGTPQFEGAIKELTINNISDRSGDFIVCTAANGSSPSGNQVRGAFNKTCTVTIDVSSLNANQLFVYASAVANITELSVVWGGSGTTPPDNPDDPYVKVTTGDASGITMTSATLSGSWSGANTSVREAGFTLGTSAADLDQTFQADLSSTGASGSFSVTLDALDPNITYYYRAYVILQDGQKIVEFNGNIASFTTALQPDVPPAGLQPGWAEVPLMNISKSGKYMINSADNTQYYAWHICPDVYGPGGKLARNYTVCYSSEHHCPVWVAAPRHTMYSTKGTDRTDAYGKDPDVPSNIQYSSKSTGGGCNKGHMLGSAERLVSASTNRQVFYYTNIAPQLSSGFNTGGGGWNTLEDYVDTQVCRDTLYEVIGCYFKKYTDGYGKTQTPSTISFGGRSDVSMPTMFYYVLLRTKSGQTGKRVADCTASELQCVAFVRTHTNELKGQSVTSKELMSVADLEKITGVTYFPNVPNAPKTSYKASDWGL